MTEDIDRDQQSGGEDENPRPVRRITFDDFEIERGIEEENASRPGFLKNAIPRIRSMKDDLLGGSGKLSTKILGANPNLQAKKNHILMNRVPLRSIHYPPLIFQTKSVRLSV